MNISGSNLPAMSGASQSGEVYSAALAKKQQKADGQAALTLIESAGILLRHKFLQSRLQQHWAIISTLMHKHRR